MKEEEFVKAFDRYRESLGTCERMPDRTVRRAPVSRKLAFGVVAAGLAGVVAVSMWPQSAKASTLQKVVRVFDNVDKMDCIFEVERRAGGPWSLLDHIRYSDGKWRHEVQKDSALRVTLIERDGKTWTEWSSLDHTTLTTGENELVPETSDSNNALHFAKGLLDSGQTSIERTVTIRDHAPIDGHEAYEILMERSADQYKATILVDKATDLPIVAEAQLHATTGLGPTTIRYRQRYRFDVSISDEVFQPNPAKPIVKVEEAQAGLLSEWGRGGQSVPRAKMLDASVAPDGTIWIASASKDAVVLPTQLSVPGGATYVRGFDVDPAGISGHNTIRVDGADLSLTPFVAMIPNGPAPERATLTYARRSAQWSNFAENTDNRETTVGNPLTLKLRIEPELRPGYFTALNLDRFGFELEEFPWNVRAKEYERQGNYLAAAKAYEKCALGFRSFVKRGGASPMLKAAVCFTKAGDIQDARRAQAEAEKLKLGD